jgi:hypothetical protein
MLPPKRSDLANGPAGPSPTRRQGRHTLVRGTAPCLSAASLRPFYQLIYIKGRAANLALMTI